MATLNTEIGVASSTNRSLSWLNGNTKGWGGVYSFATIYGWKYYQKTNVAQNCTANMTGECNCNNCGAVQTNNSGWGGPSYTNCNAYGACSNCNCDNRAWLQPWTSTTAYNNCAYNCDYNNCNCPNCLCLCR